jgi:hypothetical protein
MAQYNVSVTSSATLLAPAAGGSGNLTVLISSPAGGSITCYLGQSGFSTANGVPFPPGSTTTILNPAVAVYAICASNQQVTLSVAQNVS